MEVIAFLALTGFAALNLFAADWVTRNMEYSSLA